MLYYGSIVIIVVASVCYHLASKQVPENSNLFFFVMVSYIVGLVLSLVAFMFTLEGKSVTTAIVEQSKMMNWTPIVLGIAIVSMEVGNVLMYRAGWDISKGGLLYNTLTAVILVVVGIFIFQEQFTVKHMAGLLSCAVGLYLLI